MKKDAISTENLFSNLQQNPYKGLHSYEESDKDLFCGRGKEKEELFELIKDNRNRVVVVLGKSGMGKTSLLKAGLFPILREQQFLPIWIHLNYSDKEVSLLEQIRLNITKQLEAFKVEVRKSDQPTESIGRRETLWEYFHQATLIDRTGKKVMPVLVFDQFEEIFTIGKGHEDKERLIDELIWVIQNQVPHPFKERIEKEMSISSTKKPPYVRIVISLREDYLAQLNAFRNRSPSLVKNTFQLNHMNGNQAREVIRKPGVFQDEAFINQIIHRFYPEDVRQTLTFPDKKLEKTLEIEPTFLSLLCHQLYETKETGLTDFTKEDQDRILEDYYTSIIQKYPAKVKKFIEDNLLTSEGYRALQPLPGDDQELMMYLLQLIEKRILRKEYRGGTDYVEISHDVLAPTIEKKRARRQRKRTKIGFGLLIGFLALFVFLTIYAFYQENKANWELNKANELKVVAQALLEFPKDNTTAFLTAGKAFKMGLPQPQDSSYQVLSAIAYSSWQNPFKIATLEHSGPVYTAIFSPDYQYLLSASEDHTAKLWDINGKYLATLIYHGKNGEKDKHNERIKCAAFSPDGTKIVTASWDKTAVLWDRQGNILAELKGHTGHSGPVISAVFAPDGSSILTASRDNTAKTWDLHGNMLADLTGHKAAIATAVYSPDGDKILTASWDKSIMLWNSRGKKLWTEPITHQGAVSSALFSPDGRKFVAASWDNTACIYDLQGNLQVELKGHKDAVLSAVFSPDSDRVLTTSRDKTARLYNLHGDVTAVLNHNDELSFACFSPDGTKIATASRDGVVKLWDQEGKLLLELTGFNGIPYSVQFSNEANRLLTACEDGSAVLWTLDSNLLVSLDKHTNSVNSAVFSPDGQYVLTASDDHSVNIWTSQGKLLETIGELQKPVKSAIYSPDGKMILTASSDNTAKLWLWDDKNNSVSDPVELNKHTGSITSAVFSSDSQKIVTASEDGTVKVWDLNGRIVNDIPLGGNESIVRSAVFSPDNQKILVVSVEKTARLFGLEGKVLAWLGHDDIVNCAAFSPDGSSIITASSDNTAKLWNLDGKMLAHLQGHDGPVLTACISKDNRLLLTASEDRTAKLWDLDGTLLYTLAEHKGTINSALFSPDGKYIITTSTDKTAKFWNTRGQLLADLNMHNDIVNSAQFSPDGKRIITASQDGTAKIWLTPDAIYEWLKTFENNFTIEEKMIRPDT